MITLVPDYRFLNEVSLFILLKHWSYSNFINTRVCFKNLINRLDYPLALIAYTVTVKKQDISKILVYGFPNSGSKACKFSLHTPSTLHQNKWLKLNLADNL